MAVEWQTNGHEEEYPDTGKSRRYTDQDVRADWTNLYWIASRYLNQYTGTFHPLRAAKNLLHQGTPLEVEQLRVVLNCMIHDTQVVNMPAPIGHTLVFDASRQDAKILKFPEGGELNTDDIEFKILPGKRPSRIECKARPNPARPYWYSVQTNSYLIHVIHHLTVVYHNEQWYKGQSYYFGVPPFEKRFQIHTYMLCGQGNYGINRNKRAVGPEQIKELMEGGRKWCRPCETEYESRYPTTPLPS